MQIQTIKYGLNDTKRITNKQVTVILYSFTPSDMNFQKNLMPKVILAKILSLTWTILIFSMLEVGQTTPKLWSIYFHGEVLEVHKYLKNFQSCFCSYQTIFIFMSEREKSS